MKSTAVRVPSAKIEMRGFAPAIPSFCRARILIPALVTQWFGGFTDMQAPETKPQPPPERKVA